MEAQFQGLFKQKRKLLQSATGGPKPVFANQNGDGKNQTAPYQNVIFKGLNSQAKVPGIHSSFGTTMSLKDILSPNFNIQGTAAAGSATANTQPKIMTD